MSKTEREDKINLKEINKHVLAEAEHYRNLQVFGCGLICPYYINRPIGYITDLMRKVGIRENDISNLYQAFKENLAPYGWYQGKGTPGQIEDTVRKFLPNAGFGRPKVTSEGIRDLMRLRGIGVDCSGFVFNVFKYGFNKLGMLDEFYKSVSWKDGKIQGASHANVSVLAESSHEINQRDLQPLDLLFTEKRGHIAIVIEDTEGFMKVYQSTPWSSPSGINVSNLAVLSNFVDFSFIPSMGDSWNELNTKGEIEFRRLNIFKK